MNCRDRRDFACRARYPIENVLGKVLADSVDNHKLLAGFAGIALAAIFSAIESITDTNQKWFKGLRPSARIIKIDCSGHMSDVAKGRDSLQVQVGVIFFILAITFGASGDLIWGELHDPVTGGIRALDPALLARLTRSGAVGGQSLSQEPRSGILNFPSGQMLFVLQPILKSIGSGPPSGHYLVGRYLTTERLRGFAARTLVPGIPP